MSYEISNQLLKSLFRIRLFTKFKSYVFQLAQIAKLVKRTLIVNDIITTLINYDKRALYQNFKEAYSIKDNKIQEKKPELETKRVCSHCKKNHSED